MSARWRPFLVAWGIIVVLLVGWLATGAPLPGQQIPVRAGDLGNLRLVDGLWGVRPQPEGMAVDELVPVEEWRGLGSAYSNGEGLEVVIWAGYGSEPEPRGILEAERTELEDADGVVWGVTDPQGLAGAGIVMPIAGNRHLGVMVWSSSPDGLPADVGSILAEIYLAVAPEWDLRIPDAGGT